MAPLIGDGATLQLGIGADRAPAAHGPGEQRASGPAEQIISQAAHPSVREELRQAGRDLGLRL